MSRRRRTPLVAKRLGRGRPSLSHTERFESSRLRLLIVALVAVKIAGLILVFDPASALAFEAPKSSFSLAASVVLFGLVGLALVRFGTSELFRPRLHLAVAAFALTNVLAAVFAQDQYIALFGAQRRLGLTFVLDMLVLYLAVALAYRTVRDWSILGGAVAAAGAFAIAYGLVQYLGLDPIPWVDDVRGRPPSTFGNPDKFGHFLGATFAAALGVAILPGDWGRRIRLLAWLYSIASLGMAALVATRGTLVGLAVALPILGVLYLRLARDRGGRRIFVVAAAAAVGLVVIGTVLLLTTPLGERVRAGLGDVASQQRLFLADAALRALADRPLIGHGPDNFGVIYPQYRPAAASAFVGQDSAHSSLLQALATTGLLGAASLLLVALASLVALWRVVPTRTMPAGPLLVGGVAYWASGLVAIGSVSVDWIGWVAAGGAVALTHQDRGTAARRVSPLLQVAILGAAVIVAGWGYPAFQAGRELYAARTARSPERAVSAAERAARLDPDRAENWYALGQARQARGATAGAAQALRVAADRAPYVTGYWGSLALALANLALAGDQSLGGKEAALGAARRAIEADPSSPTPHNLFAVVAKALGDPASALDASAVAVRLYKGEPEYDTVAVDAALRMSDASAARLALERIVREKDSAVLRLGLAQLSLRLKDAAAARMHVQRALELDPQNASARDLAKQLGP